MQASAQVAHSVWPQDRPAGVNSAFLVLNRLPHSTQAKGSKATQRKDSITEDIVAQHGMGRGEKRSSQKPNCRVKDP